MYAAQAGWNAARRTFEDPSTAYGESFQCGQNDYRTRWGRYSNEMFERASAVDWSRYKADYKLYRNIRSLQNPCKQLVEFYVSNLYPGVISRDGLPFPSGRPSAIPFSDDTPPELIAAIAQIWQWSNWQLLKSRQIRYCAATGDVLSEIIDDVERGKVYLEVVWPGQVYDLELDHAGNIDMYVLEYPAIYENESYVYRKEVDKESIRYFKNGSPFDYGYGAVVPNTYGFVPAAWTRHQDTGGIHGVPAIAGSEALLDELNGLLCMIVDKAEQIARNPSILWGSVNARGLSSQEKRAPTNDLPDNQNSQESVAYITGQAGGRRESLVEPLDFASIDIVTGRLIDGINKNHRELVFNEKIMEMSQLSGVAVLRVVSDIVAKVQEAQAGYDQQNMSLWRMATAIAGMRGRERSGGWGQSTAQQQKFAPFDLNSYERGDLDMAIAERPLLAPTGLERAMEDQTVYTGVKLATDAGIPLALVLRRQGWSDEDIAELDAAQREQEAQIQRDQMLAQEDKIPVQGQ